MEKFTPLGVSKDAVPKWHYQVTVYEETTGERVATVFHEPHTRLFVAAPELLEACEAVLTLLEQGQAGTLTLEHDGAYLRDAIKKARG